MSDLISRAAALDAIDGMKPMQGNTEQLVMKLLCWATVKTIQPVDAVPVVRCRECRHWRQEVSPTEHWVCAHHSFNERKMYTTPAFYCADGERRDDA